MERDHFDVTKFNLFLRMIGMPVSIGKNPRDVMLCALITSVL